MRVTLPLALLILALPATAADVRKVNCRFLGFGPDSDGITAISISSDGSETTHSLSAVSLSERVECEVRNNELPFLTEERKPMATARVGSGVRSVILVFLRGAASAGGKPPGWRIFVIDDSPRKFPDGGAFVANFYHDNIRFVIGEHKGMLKPAGAHGYAMPKKRDDFNMAPVIFELHNVDRWRTANESSLRFLPGMRYLIIAFVDPASGRPRINTYQDFTPPSPSIPSPPPIEPQ